MQKRQEEGMALISVMWGLMVLSILSLSVLAVARQQSHITTNLSAQAQAEATADAALYQTIQQLSSPGAPRKFPGVSENKSMSFAAQNVRIDIYPENGKIDLNTAKPHLISALFAYHGLEENRATLLMGEVVRLRTQRAPEKPFKTVDDLMQITDSALLNFSCLRPYLTVYSDRTTLSLPEASQDVKKLIKWAAKEQWGDIHWKQPALTGTGSVLQQSGSFAGKAFTIAAKVKMQEGYFIRKSVIVRITGNRATPFWTYAWGKSSPTDINSCKTAS